MRQVKDFEARSTMRQVYCFHFITISRQLTPAYTFGQAGQ
jgi:hypothetical protein